MTIYDPSSLEQKAWSPTIASIDDFLRAYSDLAVDDSEIPSVDEWNIDIPRSDQDALEITNIYNEIYRGQYPYKEMLDSEFVHETFSDPSYFWGIFRSTKTKEVGGCFTITVDFENRVAYFRGLNIRPKVQKRVNVRKLSIIMTLNFLHHHQNQIDKWYSEVRTAHNITQYLCYAAGCFPKALLINKDYFLGQKESDVLMVSYFDHCFLHRKPVSCLHEQIREYFEFNQEDHPLPEEPKFISDYPLTINHQKVFHHLLFWQIHAIQDDFGYTHITISNASKKVIFTTIHTLAARNIEKIQYSLTNPEEFFTFYILLSRYAHTHEVEYIEWILPVSQLENIEILIRNKVTVQGYLPAWCKKKSATVIYEDAVLFGWSSTTIHAENLQLIPKSEDLLYILLENMGFQNKALQPNVLGLSHLILV